ncbi:MAG: Obg family GTPase CgtA, partial [Clostridiaceae bacterium]|nr:Obg family GTPase CgtA [Clostridiaceae bacterium]
VFENFKKKLNEMGYDDSKIFKICAVTNEGVEDLMKEATRILTTIPVTELVIADDEKYIVEEKHFTYTIEVDAEGTYVVDGTFVDRLLNAVNINEPDSLKYFHKVLKNKGVFDALVAKGIQDGDLVRLNKFEFEFLL